MEYIEHLKLFEVWAQEDAPYCLASFNYREWAEEWRDQMCATGVIKESQASAISTAIEERARGLVEALEKAITALGRRYHGKDGDYQNNCQAKNILGKALAAHQKESK